MAYYSVENNIEWCQGNVNANRKMSNQKNHLHLNMSNENPDEKQIKRALKKLEFGAFNEECFISLCKCCVAIRRGNCVSTSNIIVGTEIQLNFCLSSTTNNGKTLELHPQLHFEALIKLQR